MAFEYISKATLAAALLAGGLAFSSPAAAVDPESICAERQDVIFGSSIEPLDQGKIWGLPSKLHGIVSGQEVGVAYDRLAAAVYGF